MNWEKPLVPTSDAVKLIEMGLGSDADTILCADGFTIRCQAGPLYESLPEYSSIGPWTHLEVEETSELDERLIPFLGFKYLYETGLHRFFRVPVETIREVIEAHGGPTNIQGKAGKPRKLKTFLILQALGYGVCHLIGPQYTKTGVKWGE